MNPPQQEAQYTGLEERGQPTFESSRVYGKMQTMYQLVFYVPKDHCESVKAAVFAAGAGRYAGYDSCAWETEGVGQFQPLSGSSPFIGTAGRVERVAEMRVEMICQDAFLGAVLSALMAAHPYEQPAYSYFSVNPPLIEASS